MLILEKLKRLKKNKYTRIIQNFFFLYFTLRERIIKLLLTF